jgi:hypothetical protein
MHAQRSGSRLVLAFKLSSGTYLYAIEMNCADLILLTQFMKLDSFKLISGLVRELLQIGNCL